MQRILSDIPIECTLNPVQTKLGKREYFRWFIKQDLPEIKLDLAFLVYYVTLFINQVANSIYKLAIFINCSAFHSIKLKNYLFGLIIFIEPSNNISHRKRLTLVRIHSWNITLGSELRPYEFYMAI